jgi:hypothetical protein
MSEKYFAQPSVMTAQQHFAKAPSTDIQRSKFDRSHSLKTTLDAGKLYPVFLDEALPGDTFTMDATFFTRLSTPLKPIMDNLYFDVHFFFVPCRLVWDNWQKFMGERVDPSDDPSIYSIPQLQVTVPTAAPTANDLNNWHYFGLPYVRDAAGSATTTVNALPFRALGLIYNEWFRDQNLQDSIDVPLDDALDTSTTLLNLYPRGKRHDYFTSCLPWPQKGDPVIMPLGTAAPIKTDLAGAFQILPILDGNDNYRGMYANGGTADKVFLSHVTDESGNSANALYADLTAAQSATINEWRDAYQMQVFLERDARSGTRYIELILSHFGVKSSDARLQRPEFLSYGSSRININPIAATVADGSTPQANLAATGTGITKCKWQKAFEEHGYVIGVASVRADLNYQRGVNRLWSRSTRYDFYWPEFAHLGEQTVLNKEIFFQSTGDDDDVFGYQERYAEYRYKPSLITGIFNSDASASLDVWHLAQDFASLPALNASFIEENPPVDRIVAVTSEPQFLSDAWFSFHCDRPMPVYSIPGLSDAF